MHSHSAGCSGNCFGSHGHIYMGDPTEKINKEINSGKKIAFTFPEAIFITISAHQFKGRIQPLPPGQNPNSLGYFLLHRGPIELQYNILVKDPKKRESTSECDIAKVARSVFLKVDHVFPSGVFLAFNAINLMHFQDSPMAVNHTQLMAIMDYASRTEELLKAAAANGETSYPRTALGSKDSFPKAKGKIALSDADYKNTFNILDSFMEVVPKDETLKPEQNHPTSKRDWRVFESTDPKYFICVLILKDPATQLQIIGALHKAGIQAKPMRCISRLESLAVVILDKQEPNAETMRKIEKAKDIYKVLK